MNKTSMQFRTTAELIFILTKWRVKGKKKKRTSQIKRNMAPLESENFQDKAISFQESE